jgi:hypothetical protein
MGLLEEIQNISDLMGQSPTEGFKLAGLNEEEWATALFSLCPNIVINTRLNGFDEEMSLLIQFILCSGALIYTKLNDKTKVQ